MAIPADPSTRMARGQLRTVRGPVACDNGAVQWVLPHEHLFHNIYAHLAVAARVPPGHTQPFSDVYGAGTDGSDIRPDQLHQLRVDPTLLGGRNLRMEREDEIFREVQALSQNVAGTGVIIDVTTAKEGRDLAKLRRLAERVGVHIVASASCNEIGPASIPASLPLAEKIERVAKTLETELMFGDGDADSDGAPGIIYQQVHLRVEAPQRETDGIVLQALAMAQKNTGAPLFLSFSQDESPPESAHRLTTAISNWITSVIHYGASPGCVVFCHADLWTASPNGVEFLIGLARQGVVLSFDMVGHYTVSDAVTVNPCLAPTNGSVCEPPRDSTVAACLSTMIHQHGLADRILVSSGVQQRIQLLRYGGGGYPYALHHFKQRLLHRQGVSLAHWQQITCTTPLRLLLWYSPPAAAEIPKHFLRCTICAEYFEPIVGEYFTKFQFVYCGTKCLRKHSKQGFKPLE